MKHTELDNRILARYLSGDCTDEESRLVRKWIQQNARNEHAFKEFKYIWNKARNNSRHLNNGFDAEQDWELIKEQLVKQQTVTSTKSTQASPHRRRNYLMMRAAAIILICTFIGYFGYQNWQRSEAELKEPALQEIATAMGQRVDLTLSDGTRVLLNADSRLRLPVVFTSGRREVFLEGQAYFEVASNSDKPFLIHLEGSTIRVLGTAFSVSAYPEDTKIHVVVEEGRVSFNAKEQKSSKTILTENELAAYDKKSAEIETRVVEDLSLHLSWIDGYLKFDETPMAEVAVDMERRYDIEVIFEDPQIKKMILTAYFKSWSIRNVLDVIAISLNIEYRLENKRVIFFNH